jgi:hypothetical protein
MATDLSRYGDVQTFNGKSWSAPTRIDGENQVTAVSCASARFCMAVDDFGGALKYKT